MNDLSIDPGFGIPSEQVNQVVGGTLPIQTNTEEQSLKEESDEPNLLEILEPDVKPEPIVIKEFNDRFLYDKNNRPIYYNRPFFKGQSKKPGMYRIGHPKAKVFHLSNPDELEDYNLLLAGTGIEGQDPQYINLSLDKQFWQGEFIVLAMYNEMWYLLPDQK